MNLNELIERFTLVSGYERKTVSRFLPILLDCKEFFEERIGRELTAPERRRVTHACAVYAFRSISRLGGNDGISGFRAGDVQLDLKEAGDRAGELWEEAKAAVADIVSFDDGFSFRAVRI